MEYPSSRYPVKNLFTGSSLGNRFAFAQIDAVTKVRGLWSSIDNQFYGEEWKIDFELKNEVLSPPETFFYREFQTTTYRGKEIEVEKHFFLPHSDDGARFSRHFTLPLGGLHSSLHKPGSSGNRHREPAFDHLACSSV